MSNATEAPILVMGAMDVETDYIIGKMTDVKQQMIGKWSFASGLFEGRPLVVCRTEWGVANAAACAALAMEAYHPCAVISQGTSGAHDPELLNYDIVIGKKTVNTSAWKSHFEPQGSVDDPTNIEAIGVFAYDKHAGKFTQEVYHYASKRLLAAARKAEPTYTRGHVVEGTIGTCDTWNCQVDRVLFLHKFFESSVEDMESDAVAQICQTYDVPFLAIRIVSNSVFEGDQDWDLRVGPVCQEFVLNVIRNIEL